MGELLKEMGQRTLDRRKQLKLTQEALAKMAHVTPQTVSTAELGTKAMRPETCLLYTSGTEWRILVGNIHRLRVMWCDKKSEETKNNDEDRDDPFQMFHYRPPFRVWSRRWIMSARIDRKSTRLNSSHSAKSRMPSSA